MSEKMKKEISPYLFVVLIVLLLFGFNFLTSEIKVNAQLNNTQMSTSVEVGNAAPTVVVDEFSGASTSDIVIIEGAQTAATLSATITDTNSGSDVTSAKAYFTIQADSTIEDLATDSTACPNVNDQEVCYKVECSLGTPSGNNVTCTATASIWYFATPTDAASSQSATRDWWSAYVYASDSAGGDGFASSSSGIDVGTLAGLDASTSVNFSSLSPGNNTGASPIESGVENTGNKHIDPIVGGGDPDYSLCSDYPTCAANTLVIGQEQYASASTTYSDAFNATLTASTSNTEYNLCLPKTTNSGNRINDTLFWGFAVPGGQATGTYSGRNYIIADGGDASASELRPRTGECTE